MKISFSRPRIAAISTTIPEKIISLQEQADVLYNGNLKQVARITKSIGLEFRHICDDLTTTLDLCFNSAREIIDKFKDIKIDGLICVTQTPDFLMPNNSHILHNLLDLDTECVCLDINQGCSGYVYGLFTAFMMIENGFNNILLCVGDTLSKVVNPTDSNTAPLFGDAGSATLITSGSSERSYFSLHSDGKGWENLIIPNSAFRTNPNFTKANPNSKYLYMDGAEVFNFSISRETEAINEMLGFANIRMNSVDYLFFHQANAYIISNIARRVNIPLNKAPSDTTGKYGNASSASIPLAICDKASELSGKNSHIILSGFGVGLSWATAYLKLDSTSLILEPLILKKGDKNDKN